MYIHAAWSDATLLKIGDAVAEPLVIQAVHVQRDRRLGLVRHSNEHRRVERHDKRSCRTAKEYRLPFHLIHYKRPINSLGASSTIFSVYFALS